MSRENSLVTADWVEEHLNDPKVVLIEVDEDVEAYEANRHCSSTADKPAVKLA